MLLPVMRLAGFFINKSFKGTMTKKTITICGKEVEMFYCAATENGYERMSGKQISVFVPTFKTNEEGKTVIDKLPETTNEDYLQLAIAGIVAADYYYEREPSITSKDILYDATPTEMANLITSIVELRAEWYSIAKVVEDQLKEDSDGTAGEDHPKN